MHWALGSVEHQHHLELLPRVLYHPGETVEHIFGMDLVATADHVGNDCAHCQIVGAGSCLGEARRGQSQRRAFI